MGIIVCLRKVGSWEWRFRYFWAQVAHTSSKVPCLGVVHLQRFMFSATESPNSRALNPKQRSWRRVGPKAGHDSKPHRGTHAMLDSGRGLRSRIAWLDARETLRVLS